MDFRNPDPSSSGSAYGVRRLAAALGEDSRKLSG
jgi:hypothetical protein